MNDQQPNEAPPIVQDVLRSNGHSLDFATRAFFEPRLGHDLSSIRVHTDAQAMQSARSIDALAYAYGRDLAFAPGQFAPGTERGRKLIAHELAHTIQQRAPSANDTLPIKISSPGDASERAADRIADVITQSMPAAVESARFPAIVARRPVRAGEATTAERSDAVESAARWLAAMATQVETLRRLAAHALATTPGTAAGPRAFHRYLSQDRLGRMMANAISVFEAQRSQNPRVNFPVESPQQTRLGEAYALAMEQFGLAIEEARINAANLAPAVREAEIATYAHNHLRWLEGNPSAPLAAGIRTTFTATELQVSTRRHRVVASQLANLAAMVHRYNLSGNGAQRVRDALNDALYRLVQNRASAAVDVQRDTALEASVRPILEQLRAIQWGVNQAVDRLRRAETRTRDFASDPGANRAVGDTLNTHFSTRDPGYAMLLADRLARMGRELRGEGSLAVHARNPQDSRCGISTVGSGFSVTAAYAEPNHIHFCSNVSIGNESTVSTLVHETVHAVIPSLGAAGAVTSATQTPDDRAYAYERIYSRLSTEEALANAESYSFYVDDLLGVAVRRPSAPQDVVTACSDAETVHDAIARATYRIRVAAMWASQSMDRFRGGTPPAGIVTIVAQDFPGADATRAAGVLAHLRNLANQLEYYLPVTCRRAGDREARAGALVYSARHAAKIGSVTRTTRTYRRDRIRICPAWFLASKAVRENTLTSILVLRYRSSVPLADVAGMTTLIRYIAQAAYPSVTGRTLQQHQDADVAARRQPQNKSD